MAVIDETEVIMSTHEADDDSVSTDGDKSPLYHDTHVTSQDRSVRFWNTGNFSDVSNNKERKIRFGITIEGHGINREQWTDWDEYTSQRQVYHTTQTIHLMFQIMD